MQDGAKQNYFGQFPDEDSIREILPESFIINRPMNGVGGDGYWMHENEERIFIVVFDCMGHGHLASMMTRIYTKAINKIVVENGCHFPNKILHLLHLEIKKKFENNEKKMLGTGADIGIIVINKHIDELEFAGAKMGLVEVVEGELRLVKGDRLQVGEMFDYEHNYKAEIINLRERVASTYYLFSDGVTDLIGGPNQKKLSLRTLKEIILENQSLSLPGQKEFFMDYMDRWSGSHKPLDDVLLLGFRI